MIERIIYIASPNSQEIHAWSMDKKESLKLIQVLDTPGQVQPIIIHPKKNILYAGIRPNPKIVTYRIKHDGTLNEEIQFAIPSYSTHLHINVMGTMLYSVSYRNNCLNVIKLDYQGNCISTVQQLTGLIGCHSSYIEIPRHRLWVPCLKENCIRLYNINKIGYLDINSLQTIYSESFLGPRHMVFQHSYDYAYLVNELNSTVSVIKIEKTLNYEPIIMETISIIPDNKENGYNNKHHWASDIHITPDDRWLYCSERSMNIIACFKVSNIKKNKKLELIDHQPTEMQPRGCAIDNKGKFLMVAGEKSNFFSIYNINKDTGKLVQLSRLSVGDGPTWIAILNKNND